MKFDNERFVENINKLIEMKGYKIGDIEKKAGVSIGYISKLSSRGSEGGPATAITFNFAKALGVSVEQLVNGDFGQISSSIDTINRFVDKLLNDTEANKIEWNAYSINKINELLDDEDGEELPFLIHFRNKKSLPYCYEGDYSCSKYSGIFRKVITYENHELKTCCAGSAFVARIENNTRVWVVALQVFGDENNRDVFYEIYIDKRRRNPDLVCEYMEDEDDDYFYDWESIPLCSTLTKAGVIKNNIMVLYDVIVRHDNDLKIDKEAKEAIMNYLGEVDYVFK